ncbi:MAG: hypothetical protein V1487_03310 [bacterium]
MPKFKIWLLLILATFLAYGASLKYGFSQDDWYFLSISQARTTSEVFNFFNPFAQSGFAFFRPLGTQLYYFIFTAVFGLVRAPFFMHLFMLLLQASCGYFVYSLVTKLKVNHLTAILIGLVYATSSAQFLSLFYIAATQQLLSAFFGLLSLNYFLDNKSRVSSLFFLLALLSKETAIMIPFIAIILTLLQKQKLSFQKFIPYFSLFTCYLLLRLLPSHAAQTEYQFVFGLNVVSTLRWYLLFAFGAAEEWIRYATPAFGINLPQFIRDFGILGFSITLFTSLTFLLFLFSLLRNALRQIILYLAWFTLALAPVLFLLNHRYPHYLDLALIPLLLIVYQFIRGRWQYVLTLFLIAASLSTISLSQKVHWTTGRARMSAQAISILDWPTICTHNAITFTGGDSALRQLSYTLSLANGARVLCNNPVLEVSYQGQDNLGGENAYLVDVGPIFK